MRQTAARLPLGQSHRGLWGWTVCSQGPRGPQPPRASPQRSPRAWPGATATGRCLKAPAPKKLPLNQTSHRAPGHNQLRMPLAHPSSQAPHPLRYLSFSRACSQVGAGLWTHPPGSGCPAQNPPPFLDGHAGLGGGESHRRQTAGSVANPPCSGGNMGSTLCTETCDCAGGDRGVLSGTVIQCTTTAIARTVCDCDVRPSDEMLLG